MTSAIAEIGGPGIAGALVQLITAPMAMLVDAVSYVFSAFTIGAIGAPRGRSRMSRGPPAYGDSLPRASARWRGIRSFGRWPSPR
jgi:hypothetical protein